MREQEERDRLKKLVEAGQLSESCLYPKRPERPKANLNELTMEDKQKLALKLMDKKSLKKFEKLQKKKVKAEQKMKNAKAKVQQIKVREGSSKRQLKKEAKKKRYLNLKSLKKSQKESFIVNSLNDENIDENENQPGPSEHRPEDYIDQNKRKEDAKGNGVH